MAMGHLPFETEQLHQLFTDITNGKTKTLPRPQFSASMCMFVNQCLQQAPEKRPHPRTLIEHPFIAMYNDGNVGIVADYVKHKLSTAQLK